jgi:hypothetical protein
MPLIRDYNSNSNIYGLKGHSTFMSVCKFRSFMKRNLRSSHADSFSRSCFFLPDLQRRSIVPTVAPSRCRSFFVTSSIREKSILGLGKPKVQKTPSLCSLSRNNSVSERVTVPPCRVTIWSLRSTGQRVQAAVRLV